MTTVISKKKITEIVFFFISGKHNTPHNPIKIPTKPELKDINGEIEPVSQKEK